MDSIRSIELEHLPAVELDRRAYRIMGKERVEQAKLLAHLGEIRARGLYRDLGYSNMFEYCVKRLGVSEGAAHSRNQIASVCREYPQMLELIAKQQMSLTVAGKIAPHLTRENAATLFKDCAGMTKRQVEEYLVRIRPKPVVSSGVSRAPGSPEVLRGADFLTPMGTQELSMSPMLNTQEPTRGPRSRHRDIEPATPEVFNFRFSANTQLKQKIERLGEVMGIHDVSKMLAQVVETAVDCALEKKDPQQKLERRKKREAKKAEKVEAKASTSSRPDEVKPTKSGEQGSGYVPSVLREQALEEAGYRCTYVGPNGRRCEARAALEIDHRKPRARGGTNDKENLRPMCRPHNQLEAEREFGREFMRAKRE